MSEIAASITLLTVLFALLAGGVWVGLTLAWPGSACRCSAAAPRATPWR